MVTSVTKANTALGQSAFVPSATKMTFGAVSINAQNAGTSESSERTAPVLTIIFCAIVGILLVIICVMAYFLCKGDNKPQDGVQHQTNPAGGQKVFTELKESGPGAIEGGSKL
jgi:heme/copper-type cytochrome/quinol oxidase subunit 2